MADMVDTPAPVRVSHWNGDPDGCSEHCSEINTHPDDDAPEVCGQCGGSGRGCAGAPTGCHHNAQAAADARDVDDYRSPETLEELFTRFFEVSAPRARVLHPRTSEHCTPSCAATFLHSEDPW